MATLILSVVRRLEFKLLFVLAIPATIIGVIQFFRSTRGRG
jgi:hypothetical protein